MEEEAKHALFAAAALHALLVVDQAKPISERNEANCIASDAVYFADIMLKEIKS